ncbi:MAG: hypothetical protein R2792_17780 [Saprospiraceae bacterium]
MKTGTILAILVLLLVVAFCLSFCTRRGKSNSETFDYPPFSIKRTTMYSSRYDLNTARKVNDSRSYYSVLHHGQTISFPQALEENTGVKGLWKVYHLKDAPRPALLAGSLALYLITEENDSLLLKPVNEGNSSFVSMQWLDSEDGQPGEKMELYSSNDTGFDCQLDGGRYLLINKSIVLDVQELSLSTFELFSGRTQDFYAETVLGFSPDKEQIVFMASNTMERGTYALVVYNFKTDQVYTIPFDRTETRLDEPFFAKSDWLLRFFSWKQNTDGTQTLEKRILNPLPNWEGHFFNEKSYSLSPVKEEMQAVFVAFIKEQFNVPDSNIRSEQFGSTMRYTITLDKSIIGISYLDDLQSVYMSPGLLDKDNAALLEAYRSNWESV